MKEGRVDKEINNNIDIKKMRNVEERERERERERKT